MTCKIQKIKTDFYLPEKDDIFNFDVDQTVIINEDYLKFVSQYKKRNRNDFCETTLGDDWYPYVNSYYPYTEDVDAFARVSHLLGSKPSFASVSSLEGQSQDDIIQDRQIYSESAAQLHYLESNPFSFIILGKPDIGQQKLGKLLADHWQCVYIDPEILIEQEINSGSRAGQCIEFNLKCGRAIGIDVILRLVEKRVRSDTAKHRGFVICGLPVIPNDLYEEDPISSESAIFTVKEIFEELFESTMDVADTQPSKPHASLSSNYKSEELTGEEEVEEKENVEEEEDEEVDEDRKSRSKPATPKFTNLEIPLDTGPDYDLCHAPEIGTNFEDQLNFIFDLMKPQFMIIYIMCSSADVLEIRDNYRFDVQSKETINLQTELHNKLIFQYLSKGDNMKEVPEDFLETDYMGVDTSRMNYLVKLPRHFPANVSTQLDSFHYAGLNFIERRVLMHDPQYFLKVDGRVSIQRMLNIVKARLTVLPLQQVVLPSRLNVEPLDVGEEGPLEFEPKRWYKEFSRIDVPSSIFNWNWSDWGTKCPVAMKNGKLKDGDPTYAVHFMNKIFFLANEENFFKFYRNPRPFLLPPYPKPTCKIFVFGPKFSGKTAVARCLGYLLNGTSLSVADMVALYIMSQQEELKEKARQAAIAEALNLLNEQRVEEAKVAESERIEKIKQWLLDLKKLIENLIAVFEEMAQDQTVTSFEISSFPMAMKRVSVVESETPLKMEFVRLKDQIQNMHIPFSQKVEDWQAMLKDKRKLLIYLPVNLRTKIVPKPATVFDDFVVDYARNAMENVDLEEASLSNKSLANIIINNIRTIEETRIQQGNSPGGWILDGVLCDNVILDEMYPDFMADEVITLLDEEDSNFLVHNFENEIENEFENYREFFMNLGKLDAAWRSPAKLPKKSSAIRIVNNILLDIINDPGFNYQDEEPLQKSESYRKEISTFNNDWREIKKYFLEHNIQPIEIKVTNKSLTDIMTETINKIEDRYRVGASLYTELDRAEDVKNFGSQMLQKNISEGDFVGDEGFVQNRRYGDTYYYCPVTFYENWVLWKGKEDYAVKFENKLYLLSCEQDMNKFLKLPRNYLTREPPVAFPPPRICVIGVPGIGKTTLAKALATNYGLFFASFESVLKKYLGISVTQSLNELRRSEVVVSTELRDYLNKDTSLPENIFKDHISKLWFEQPNLGFVFDDFPKRPSDIQFMTKYKLIPDIIINLTNNAVQTKSKLVKEYLKGWEMEIEAKRLQLEKDFNAIRLEWEINRNKRFDELIEEKKELRYSLKRKNKEGTVENQPADLKEVEKGKNEDDVRKSGFTSESQVSFDSVAEQNDINEVMEILAVELPEPIFKNTLERIEKARERFEALASNTFNVETGFVKNIRSICATEEIPFTDVTAYFDNPELTTRYAFVLADKFKFRTRSHFERCYDVSMEVADRLLSCGYFFLSKFGKTCPVQYFEDKNPIQMYVPMEEKQNLFPVIHRSYIYYLMGRENQIKFKEDPLKYILIDSFQFPLISFKVAVIGPPKCGKTVLCKRLAKEYSFKLISRGQAVRYVLTLLPLCDLAKRMESVLREGWELTDEMVMKCAEAASFDGKAVTQGIVLDGFPNTINEVRHLSYIGLVPNLALDLQATRPEIFDCLSFDEGHRGMPKYNERFVEHLIDEWEQYSTTFRKWFDREYQVMAKISIRTSNWSVWSQAKNYIAAVFFEIKHYFVHAPDDWPLRLANMQITPLEFLERQGAFKMYCPCCLHFSNTLTYGGEPPDRTGLVQYRYFFYWVCHDHIETFLRTPDTFMIPYNNHNLPLLLPRVMHSVRAPENIFEDGACVVCYKQKRLFIKGTEKLAVAYNDKTYLFNTKDCRREFTRAPQDYMCEINFKPPDNYPELKYEDLPITGMLEQYVAKYITRALSFVSRHRPIIPGLGIQSSALIGVGVFLKMYNPRIHKKYKPFYKEANDLYNKRRTKLITYLDKMKSVINPYLHYEEPLPDFEYPPSIKTPSTDTIGTTVTKIVDELVDNIDYDT